MSPRPLNTPTQRLDLTALFLASLVYGVLLFLLFGSWSFTHKKTPPLTAVKISLINAQQPQVSKRTTTPKAPPLAQTPPAKQPKADKSPPKQVEKTPKKNTTLPIKTPAKKPPSSGNKKPDNKKSDNNESDNKKPVEKAKNTKPEKKPTKPAPVKPNFAKLAQLAEPEPVPPTKKPQSPQSPQKDKEVPEKIAVKQPAPETKTTSTSSSTVTVTQTESAKNKPLTNEPNTSFTVSVEEKAIARIVSETEADIHRLITATWTRRASTTNKMQITLRVRLMPSGRIIQPVTVIKNTGDAVFEESVRQALDEIEVLPVPEDTAIFRQYFKTLTLVFSPE